MDVITYALAKKMGGGGGSITYTLTADTENKTIVLTPSEGTAQVITVPYATDASTVNGHEVPELENGKIPANFLPSFVDNVDEYDNISLFPVVGESNRIYIDKSTNKTYRWSGTAYVEISESIALGETSSTAYRGDRGKIAYDHSQSAHAPSNAEANQNAFSNVKIDSDIINASTATDTLEFIAGDNIILTPNVSNKKITVSQVPVRATASGNIASFSDGTGDPFLEVKVNIEPVQSGSGDPSPTNVRPISGWTGRNIFVRGINQWDEEWRNGYYNNGVFIYASDGICCKNKIPINPNTTLYYVKNFDINTNFYYTFYDKNGDFLRISGYDTSGRISKSSSGAINVPNGAYFMTFNMGGGYGATYNNNISINYPSTDTSYHAYNGSTTSIPFHDSSDNPITVYGGMLNVTSGELVVDRAMATFNGSETWYLQSINSYGIANFYIDLDHYPKINFRSLCNSLSPQTSFITETETEGYFVHQNGTNVFIRIFSSRASTVKEFKTWLASNPIQLVYELATPTTYQLTPTQVSTLLGQNNIFANCGQIEVAYKTPFYTDLTTKNEVQVLINESITSALNASY